MDTRVFTEEGRDEIVEEQSDLGDHAKATGATLTTLAVAPIGIASGLLDNEDSDKTQIEKVQDNLTVLDNALSTPMDDSNAEIVAKEQLYAEGELTNKIEEQATLNTLHGELAEGTDAQNSNIHLVNNLTEARGYDPKTGEILGSTNISAEDKPIYLGTTDTAQDHRVNTMINEITNANGQGEASSTVMGNIGEIVYEAGSWANSNDIDKAKSTVNITDINNANSKTEQDNFLAENRAKLETEQADGDEFRNGCWKDGGYNCPTHYEDYTVYSLNRELHLSQSEIKSLQKGRNQGKSQGWNEIEDDLIETAKDLNPFDLKRRYNNLVGMYEFMQNPIDNATTVVMSKVDFYNAVKAAEAKLLNNPTEEDFRLYGELSGIWDTKVFWNATSVVVTGGTASAIKGASLTNSAIRGTITNKSSTRYNNPQTHREDLARQVGIPKEIDFSKPKSVYGSNGNQLAQYFEIRNYRTVRQPPQKGTSGNTQVYTIENHPTFKEVQYSPSTEHLNSSTGKRSKHVGEYIKYTIKEKTSVLDNKVTPESYLYIIDPKTFQQQAKGDSKGKAQVFDKNGNKLKYNPTTLKYEIDK